jgi:hypothetical protein
MGVGYKKQSRICYTEAPQIWCKIMTAIETNISPSEIIYPSQDSEPVAETYDHLYALLTTLEVLRQHVSGQTATVLGNQFLYYSQGFPNLRVAPDVMVIFGVTPGGRDNYKIWEEGQVPSVIFEITSKGTQEQDKIFKKMLYAQLGVQEYWLFDPKGEWIEHQLQGYRLQTGLEETFYTEIANQHSQVLHLQLKVEGKLIGFYREETGEKLLIADELVQALQQQTQARLAAETRAQQAEAQAQQAESRAQQAEAQAAQERQRADRLAARLREMGIDPNEASDSP